MKTSVKVLSLIAKVLGFVGALNVIPGVSPEVGVWIFLGASIAKDAINRVGDVMDDGQANGSFK